MTQPDSPWITVEQAARRASVSRDTIYAACEADELRHARVGGRRIIRLREEWIDAWLDRYSRAATLRPPRKITATAASSGTRLTR